MVSSAAIHTHLEKLELLAPPPKPRRRFFPPGSRAAVDPRGRRHNTPYPLAPTQSPRPARSAPKRALRRLFILESCPEQKENKLPTPRRDDVCSILLDGQFLPSTRTLGTERDRVCVTKTLVNQPVDYCHERSHDLLTLATDAVLSQPTAKFSGGSVNSEIISTCRFCRVVPKLPAHVLRGSSRIVSSIRSSSTSCPCCFSSRGTASASSSAYPSSKESPTIPSKLSVSERIAVGPRSN